MGGLMPSHPGNSEPHEGFFTAAPLTQCQPPQEIPGIITGLVA